MRVSQTDICNLALGYLGGNAITEMNPDESVEAELCVTMYPHVRDACLEDVDWSFAIKRYRITTETTDKPAFGFARKFRLPEEVLRVIDFNEDRDDWKLEGRDIVTDAAVAEIRCIIQVEDPTWFTAEFIQYFATRLAAEMAIPLTSSPQLQASYMQAALGKKRFASANDGRQGRGQVKTMTHRWRR